MTPGWLHEGEGGALARHATTRPGPWVEIGSYCGLSTTHLGHAAEPLGITVFAVDPHKGNPEMSEGRECHHPEVWSRENGSLTVLLETLHAERLDGTVVPVVGTGAAFAQTGIRPGFVFIDASHDYDDVKADWQLWSDRCDLIALHDASTGGPAEVAAEALGEGWSLVDQVESLVVIARQPTNDGDRRRRAFS